jgi:hypothetical protein
VFEKIFREMQAIHFRLDELQKSVATWSTSPIEISESKLISIPNHLRKTLLSVAAKGECDATIASNNTGRCRALESNYLNQLARMGWLNKRKLSKTTIYSLAQKMHSKGLAIEKVNELNVVGGLIGDDFKKYFTDPLDTGSSKRIS